MTPPGDTQRPPPWKLRRASAERWAAVNPILADGEPCYEKGTGRLKIGDGVKRWLELPYFVPEDDTESSPPSTPPSTPPPSPPVVMPADLSLQAHVVSDAPHPFYDDGRNLQLLYQNAKV
jgi:hypothetical protein